MIKVRNTVISLFTIVLIGCSAFAQTTIKDAFINAPFSVLPSLPKDSKLDMIDYFEHGMQRPSITFFGDEAQIISMDSTGITVQTSPISEFSLYSIEDKGDSLYVVVETVALPAKDSRVTVYNTHWTTLFSTDSGLLADWMTPVAKREKKTADIENTLSFMTAEAFFNPADNTLVFTNTSADRVYPEEYSPVKQYVKDNRKLLVTRKGFKNID